MSSLVAVDWCCSSMTWGAVRFGNSSIQSWADTSTPGMGMARRRSGRLGLRGCLQTKIYTTGSNSICRVVAVGYVGLFCRYFSRQIDLRNEIGPFVEEADRVKIRLQRRFMVILLLNH